jgi:hypothetical protein
MAEREIVKTVELKAGEHVVIELGEMQAGEQIQGSIKDAMHDNFLFTIVDEKNCKKFMETEDEAAEDEEDMMVIAEGDGKGHYQVDAEVVDPGKYFLLVESEAAALKRKIKVHLMISKPPG